MLNRIWLFTSTQYAFEDTEANWLELSGLKSSERIKEIREHFLSTLHPLFMRSHRNGKAILIQKGLLKSIQKIKKRSIQNAANARKRWRSGGYEDATASFEIEKKRDADANASPADASASVFDATASKGKDLACLLNNEVRDKDKRLKRCSSMHKTSFAREAKKNDNSCDRIQNVLEEYLSSEQINRVVKVCELTVEYVEEKIEIMKGRNPANKGAFLYAALTQDYRPQEKQPVEKKKPQGYALMQKAKRTPLSKEEFEELPEKLQKQFREEAHVIPEGVIYKLVSKPQDGGNAIERAIFDNLGLGETVPEKQFQQLSKHHRKHFESVNRPIGSIKKFHLR